jgi:fructoselysine-6-P-deglycase FrlB-like protein
MKTQTETAIDFQPELLQLDWTKRVSKEVSKLLKGIQAVTFVGTGSSYHVALWSHWHCLAETKGLIRSRAITSWDFLVGPYSDKKAKLLESKELIVVISHRGNRGMTAEILKKIGKRPHVLVCAEDGIAGKHAKIPTSPTETSQAHTMSLIGAMCATNEIIGIISKSKTTHTKLSRERHLTGQLLASSSKTQIKQSIQLLLDQTGSLHIIGGGAWHAIAFEIALKAREMVHVPGSAYNTEEFLHGPIAGVEEHDTLLLLSPFSVSKANSRWMNDRLELCAKLGESIGALVVSPLWPKEINQLASKLSPGWQSVFSLVWGQYFCLELARARNINPDTNRKDDPRYAEAWGILG